MSRSQAPTPVLINFYRENEGLTVRASTDNNGRFYIGGLKPGKYEIWIHNLEVKREINLILSIKKNEKIELNRNI